MASATSSKANDLLGVDGDQAIGRGVNVSGVSTKKPADHTPTGCSPEASEAGGRLAGRQCGVASTM